MIPPPDIIGRIPLEWPFICVRWPVSLLHGSSSSRSSASLLAPDIKRYYWWTATQLRKCNILLTLTIDYWHLLAINILLMNTDSIKYFSALDIYDSNSNLILSLIKYSWPTFNIYLVESEYWCRLYSGIWRVPLNYSHLLASLPAPRPSALPRLFLP